MLTGGFYAEVTLEYIAALAPASQGGQPFRVEAVRPIQMSTRDALGHVRRRPVAASRSSSGGTCCCAASASSRTGSPRGSRTCCSRGWSRSSCRNYNAVELGPRGTGKSHLFQQVSPYAHLVSGGKATVANMFVNRRTGRRGLVAQYDVICFDEVSGVSFDQKDGVNILKGYMESGEFSRGQGEHPRRRRHRHGRQLRRRRLGRSCASATCSVPLPKEMRDDTAFMDRIHAYLPGWDVPKLDPSYFTDHFGFVSDFLAECWSQLRRTSRLDVAAGSARLGQPAQRPRPQGGEQHGRRAASSCSSRTRRWRCPTSSCLGGELALELRRRVKEQQAFDRAAEFGKVDLSATASATVPRWSCTARRSVEHRLRGGRATGAAADERQRTATCCRRPTRRRSRHGDCRHATTRSAT